MLYYAPASAPLIRYQVAGDSSDADRHANEALDKPLPSHRDTNRCRPTDYDQAYPAMSDMEMYALRSSGVPASPEPQSPREPAPAPAPPPDESGFVRGFPLVCITVALMLAVFLTSLDRTIVSTAIPYITHEFQSTPDIGWYGSAYMLTACAFQPMFGRIFKLFSVKKVFLASLFLFEVGSLLCGVARTSITLIVGRAVAGFGSAGVVTRSFVIAAAAVPLQRRPVYMALVGIMFGVGATIGPLLGGVFTDLMSWRWCFYINLPVGGAAAVVILFSKLRKNGNSGGAFVKQLLDLDIAGNVLLLGASTMLFLALEFTARGVAWSSAKAIGLLVGFGITVLMFMAWQWRKGDAALLPPRIMMQRTVSASCGQAFMTYAALIIPTFFLPVWFQAIRGESAMKSGIDMIAYFLVNAAFSLLAGAFVSAIGYAMPPAVIGSAIGTVGLGLMTRLRVDTTTAQWVGYQILTSVGFGMSIQQGFTAVQTVLDEDDVPIGTSAVVASQSMGAAIFISVGNSVFENRLLAATTANELPGIDVKKLIDAGAASFRQLVPPDQLPTMLEIYNNALTTVFIVPIPLGALAAIISCFIEWRSVRQ